MQEVDELTEDMKLRIRSVEPNAGTSSIVEQMGLNIKVNSNENNDNDECLMYPGKPDPKQENATDAALKHYKDQSMKLKKELMINQ